MLEHWPRIKQRVLARLSLWRRLELSRWQLAVLALTLAVLASALGVVYATHLNRQLYAELQRLERERDAYQVEWGQLLLEQSTWSAPSRVERLATGRLQMEVPAAQDIRVVRP